METRLIRQSEAWQGHEWNDNIYPIIQTASRPTKPQYNHQDKEQTINADMTDQRETQSSAFTIVVPAKIVVKANRTRKTRKQDRTKISKNTRKGCLSQETPLGAIPDSVIKIVNPSKATE